MRVWEMSYWKDEEMNQKLMESSQHNFLTQLPNRNKFTQDITNWNALLWWWPQQNVQAYLNSPWKCAVRNEK